MMTPLDQDALQRAMKIAAAEPGRAEQLDSKLLNESWGEVAQFAAYCAQSRALRLKPWELPPCSVDEDNPDERDTDAQALLKRMLTSGLSRYEPDPMTALAKAEQRKVRRLR